MADPGKKRKYVVFDYVDSFKAGRPDYSTDTMQNVTTILMALRFRKMITISTETRTMSAGTSTTGIRTKRRECIVDLVDLADIGFDI